MNGAPPVTGVLQDGRKPNRNRKNRTGISETEPVAVYHETGETGNRRNRNRGFEPISKKFQMGITGVPFGRTEVLVPPPEPHERALARGKGPRGPGINRFKEKCKNVVFFQFRHDIF